MRPHPARPSEGSPARAAHLATLLAAICVSFAMARPAAAELPGPSAIERLRNATALHPDDPDLAWAFARKLAAGGERDEALRQTRRFLARWPERRPDARVEIARSLLESGAAPEARALLDEELRERPRNATARFYRGLAFRGEGLIVESNRELAVAGELAPALRAETLLARALGHFEIGEEQEAVALLQQILREAPESETAIRARLLLRQREVLALERPWRLDAYLGVEWDDNVTLESAENETPSSGRQDWRGVGGLGATWRAVTTDRTTLLVGYRFDATKHRDLDRFDLLTNTALLSASVRVDDRLSARFDLLGWNTRRDGDDELTGGTFRPNLIASLGPRAGVIRSFGQVEILEYADPPILEELDRDGWSFGGGVEYFLPLPLERSYLATSASFQRTLTQVEPNGDPLAFDGDYDYDSARIRSRATLELPGAIRARLEAGYSYDFYHNDNFFEALETGRFRKREDHIASGRVVLSRQLLPHVELELTWRGSWRMSNVSAFDYDRQVVGALLRVSTD